MYLLRLFSVRRRGLKAMKRDEDEEGCSSTP
jgi:hypothetical protein